MKMKFRIRKINNEFVPQVKTLFVWKIYYYSTFGTMLGGPVKPVAFATLDECEKFIKKQMVEFSGQRKDCTVREYSI